MSTCPQTEAEFQRYFFEDLIRRGLGSPADDWRVVMSGYYGWNGQTLRIPKGVGPGVILPADAPFYGLTQQWREGDGPVGRLFLPTSTPDQNGFYTRQIQYIRRVNPDGVTPTHVWDWAYQAGNEYVPICDGGEMPEDYGPRIETLEAQVAAQQGQIDTLNKQMVAISEIQFPEKIALIASNGKYVTAEVDTKDQPLRARGDKADAWQQFKIEAVK